MKLSISLSDVRRVLGHFEKPIFLELCRFMESRFVPAGTHLFSIGDQDDSIFVVQTGRVNVYICDHVSCNSALLWSQSVGVVVRVE